MGEPAKLYLTDLSPDEKTVAFCRGYAGTTRDIFLMDVASGESRRLTFDPHDDCGATFSPDGKRIVFFSDRRGVRELYQKAADGSGDDELLLASNDVGLHPEDWSADGRFLSYNAARPGQSHDLFLLDFTKGKEASPISFLATPAMETASTLAPNGNYMAYRPTSRPPRREGGRCSCARSRLPASPDREDGRSRPDAVSPLAGDPTERRSSSSIRPR
jgi:TolB protein